MSELLFHLSKHKGIIMESSNKTAYPFEVLEQVRYQLANGVSQKDFLAAMNQALLCLPLHRERM